MNKEEIHELKEQEENFLAPEKSNIKNIDVLGELEKLEVRILEGYDDSLKNVILLRQIEDKAKAIQDSIKASCFDELENYNDKAVIDGYTITTTSGGRYNYKNVEVVESASKRLKELQKMSQNATKMNMTEFINSDTGEVVAAAEFVPSKKGLKITKNKN